MNAMTTRTAIAILAPLLIHSVTLAWSPTATSSRRPTTAAIKLRFPPTTTQPSLNSKSSTRLLNQDLQNIDGPTQTSAESVATLAESVPPPPQPLAQTISQPAAPARSKSFGKGVWVPPSQNVSQRRGKVFAIQQPQDLLDFVIEDERLSVVKVYASWCKTCQVFDVRYRKLASQLGDKHDSSGTQILQKGRARFAEMQYDNPNNEEMCKLLNATKLPHIIMYKGSKGKVTEFRCKPSELQKLYDAVDEFADPEEVIVAKGIIASSALAGPAAPVAAVAETPKEAAVQANGELNGDSETTTKLNGDTGAASSETDDMAKKLAEMDQLLLSMQRTVESKKEIIQILSSEIEQERIKYEQLVVTKNDDVQKLVSEIEQERIKYEQMIETKTDEIQKLNNEMNQQRGIHQSELSDISSKIETMAKAASKNKQTILSLELELSYQQKATQAAENEKKRKAEEWEDSKYEYEKERNSVRKLSVLAVKRVGRGVRSLVLRLRRKKAD